mgnify:CR=1 FL=1|jgi:hypothetical protein
MGQPTFQQYQQAQQARNPWAQENPTNADYFQMITQQNMRDGMPQDVAEANAVQEMQGYMKEGINPMGPINGREAGYNESQGASQANQMQQGAQAQGIADNQAQNNVINNFNQWRMQQNLAPVGSPAGNNKGWGQANEAMQNLRNLEKPAFKR